MRGPGEDERSCRPARSSGSGFDYAAAEARWERANPGAPYAYETSATYAGGNEGVRENASVFEGEGCWTTTERVSVRWASKVADPTNRRAEQSNEARGPRSSEAMMREPMADPYANEDAAFAEMESGGNATPPVEEDPIVDELAWHLECLQADFDEAMPQPAGPDENVPMPERISEGEALVHSGANAAWREVRGSKEEGAAAKRKSRPTRRADEEQKAKRRKREADVSGSTSSRQKRAEENFEEVTQQTQQQQQQQHQQQQQQQPSQPPPLRSSMGSVRRDAILSRLKNRSGG